MRLVRAKDKTCVIASLAMLTYLDYTEVEKEIMPNLEYPFNPPWEKYPKVPCMDMICDWLWQRYHRSLTPFNKNPHCSPSPACNSVPVWYDGEEKWKSQLDYGIGLLEGTYNRFIGHMCAWDGSRVFDPRGYVYNWEDRETFEFDAERFWLWHA